MSRMTVATALRHLETAAELGKVPGEAVAALRDALTLRESRADRKAWRDTILSRLKVMRLQPTDVLVLRLPADVLADEQQMLRAQAAAREIAEVAQRGIVMLEEGAPLTAEALPQPKPMIHLPPPGMRVPRSR